MKDGYTKVNSLEMEPKFLTRTMNAGVLPTGWSPLE